MRSSLVPFLLVALAALPAGSRAAETPGTWNKTCQTPKEAAPHCAVEQIGVAEPGNRPVLLIRFENQPDGRAKLTALAPLGVSLRAGLDLVVDAAAPIKLPFERCTGQGCEVSAILDQAALEKFVKGTTLTVRYAPTDALSASVPMKLEGLAAALSTISR